jgi:hypothetical protein
MGPSDDGATRTILLLQVRIPLPEVLLLETAERSAQWQTKRQVSGLVLRTSVMSSLFWSASRTLAAHALQFAFRPLLPINTCLCSRLTDRHQETLIASSRGELSHPELSGIKSRPRLGSIG